MTRRVESENLELPEDEVIELVLRDTDLEYNFMCAIRLQMYYTRQPRALNMVS
jgi:hypothetical protein